MKKFITWKYLISIILFLFISAAFYLIVKPKWKDNDGNIVKTKNYEFYVKDFGKGSPTVIIESGLGCKTGTYDRLQQKISKYTRVISYDHAGIGRSSPSPNPRTLPYYVKELKELLEVKKIAPPYILVGHSLGGNIIRYFTYLYPNEVAGLVFIDHPHEDWFNYIRTTKTKDEMQKFNNFWDPKLSKYTGVSLIEIAEYESNCDSIRGKKIPSNIPVEMFTGTKNGKWAKSFGYNKKDLKKWAEMQHSLLLNVKDFEYFERDDADHMFHWDKPNLVVKGIVRLIDKYKLNKAK